MSHENSEKILQAMSREEIRATFIELLNASQCKRFNDITDETIISERFPDMNDFDRGEIVLDVDLLFGIEIKDEEVSNPEEDEKNFGYSFKFKTIGEWCDYIAKKMNGKK